jgi:hypothetical protein
MEVKMKKLLIIVMFVFVVSGCVDNNSVDNKMQEQTEKSLKEANSQIGMPSIVNFQERKLAKMIFELRDKSDLVCYAYIKSDYQGKLMFIGKCIGFGLPYSVQYTNPMALKRLVANGASNLSYEDHIIPQPDPNGLYMPEGLSATWLMMIDPKTNEPTPVYVEPEIVVSPFPLHID